ncbi:protein REPRESSOR OF SILENCING 3-like [Phragmites australis]|uniref:protein REPRESSOR OF SILENCING 3-like n=1 Tax=Phragmites australis TaxID=29695 RepID=UPI002D76BC9E|nr:protein REPRESSOR OF SILENCING 3-like [Phragmites australis]
MAAADGEGGGGGGVGAVVRIFVGGLAEGVSAADLEAVFASVGRVAGVEFVRTSGRSFAYVDFHCPSDKALAKLFSTYNGCKWKGGKLKLEKAKEHYLSRLKREWEQDAAAAATQEAAVKDNVEKQEKVKPEKAALEGMKINIYFPKLRKVKALPFKGTGKHKYSFRHIEVPSYPIHFCDCEEHCGLPEAANNEYASVLNAAAYQKERNIMNSVMNKLFEKENEHFDSSEMENCDVHIDTVEPSDAVNDMQIEETEEAPEEDLDDLQMEETEESSDEDLDDDLVINIAPRKSNKSVGQANMEKPKVTKDLQSRKRPRFEEASLPQKRQRSEASSEPRNRKQEPISMISDRRNTGKSLPAIPEASQNQQKSPGLTRKGTSESSSAPPRDESPTGPEGVEALTRSSTKSETAQNMVSTEPKKGSLWTQKSAWRDLVGGMGSTSFSISQVLPNTNPAPPVLPNVSESGESSKSLEATSQVLSEQKLLSSMGMPSTGTTDGSTGHDTVECKENNKTKKVRVVPKITIGEVCPFMRNAESEKQWSKAKKVLTGFKKGKESSGSNAGKGKPSKRR